MYVEVLFLFILALLTGIIFDKRFSTRKYLQDLPGPKPVPIFGNVLDFLTSSSKFLSKLMEYFQKHGEIIVVYARFSEVMILVTDYKLTEHVLSSTKILKKSYLYEFLQSWLGTGLLTSTGTKWKTHRKMLTPSFHFSILIQFIKTFDSVGDKFIEELKKEEGKATVDISPLVSLCTLDTICEAAMGVSINALTCGDSEYVRSVKTMCSIVADRIFSPIERRFYPLTPNYYKEKKTLKVLHSHTEEVIKERMKSRNSKAENQEEATGTRKLAFLDLLLDCNIDGKPLTMSELREEVDTFMFEGHDTTGTAITFALYSLATNQDVQQKVVEEQKIIFGDNVYAHVTASDLQSMRYLELVIKETLRLYPSVPLIGRELPEDLEWDGKILPKGETIGIFIYGIHRNAKYFPDPEKFIPERFESYEGRTQFSYVPFSAGPRNCIGQKFAMLEMKTILSKTIRHFELHPSIPVHVLELAPETILISKNGVRISLKRRNWA
nr:cytochrome P450 [Pharsalia antennata]